MNYTNLLTLYLYGEVVTINTTPVLVENNNLYYLTIQRNTKLLTSTNGFIEQYLFHCGIHLAQLMVMG